ncbi:MAG TPA: hypothetical protein VEC16_07190 [Alphaproteobacteria bacterium]|nr:hypothetical protein [Alphaproteobacteria bacterium]
MTDEDNISGNAGKNDFDVVIPANNEQQFVDAAISLGHKGLVFLTDDLNYLKKFPVIKKNLNCGNLTIKLGLYIRNVNDINRSKGFDYLFADAERKFFESKIHYIIDSELSDRKDSFHYKSTRLNQVHADLAKKNNQTIIFGFSNLLDAKSVSEVFGRMCQNAVLVKKYSLSSAVFSMADHPSKLRSRTILDALHKVMD